jgi:carbon-monoxide dehydrogenase large subunit
MTDVAMGDDQGDGVAFADTGRSRFVYRSDGDALVSAGGSFIADLKLPKMLEAAFVRSPMARGRIVAVDPSRALAMPGVARVGVGSEIRAAMSAPLPWASSVLHASEDAPEDFHLPAYYPLPIDRVSYEGELVAVVAAATRYGAEDAAALVDVSYEPLVPILDPEASLRTGAERIFDDVDGNLALEARFGSVTDVGSLFDDAELVLERRYQMRRSGNPPLETCGVVASYEAGRLTVWSTIQRPQILRVALSDIFGIPAARVRVISPANIGGGFGWKSPMYRETAAIAWLAMQLDRPVRWIEDRSESLRKGVHERDQIWTMRAAFDAAGRLLALDSEVVADVGSVLVDMYGLLPSRISATLPFPYDIPWIRTHLRCAITNKAPMGVNRAAGRMPAVWAIERLMDDAARALSIGPDEIRRTNFVRKFPYSSPLGQSLTDSDYLGSFDKLLEAFDYESLALEAAELRAVGRRVGVGLAACVEICRPLTSLGSALFYNQPGYASATLHMFSDGSVAIHTGDAPQGQQRHTTMASVVATELGIDPQTIEVYTGDTYASPMINSNTDVTSACGVAARRLRQRLCGIASHLMQVDDAEDAFAIRSGVIEHLASGRTMTVREAATAVLIRPFLFPAGTLPDLSETAYVEAPYSPTSFGAHAAMVEVDPELGLVTILKYGFVGDCGRPLNPVGLENAIRGGLATGIGNSLCEMYVYDAEGRLLTRSLKDYTMAGANEMPREVVIDHHDTPTPSTEYGHKRSVTEGVPAGVPPALANAIVEAFDGDIDLTIAPFQPAELWAVVHAGTTEAAHPHLLHRGTSTRVRSS